MGSIVALFARIDAAIQRRFDSACFFLMRRFGWRKSVMKFALFGLAVASLLAYAFLAPRLGPAMSFASTGAANGACFLLVCQALSWRCDRQAESSVSARSRADLDHPVFGLLKLLFAAAAVVALLGYADVPAAANFLGVPEGILGLMTACEVATCLSQLAILYLLRTPMNPPPEKERAPLFGRFAPAES